MTEANCDYGSCVRITVCSSQGGRKYMEDRVNVHCKRKLNGDLDYIFLGVYDGHGGADASHFAQEHLRLAITEQKGFHSDDDENVLRAIKDGFLQTHYEMWKTFENWPKTASGYPSTSGTTASVAILKRGKVYLGHVGDSGVVIGRRYRTLDDRGLNAGIDGIMLTVDHKPDHPEEIKRIENVGGEVMNKSGIMRVVWTRTIRGHQGPVRRSTSIEKVPFLAVARALGDLWSYNSALDQFVVSPEPDVSVISLEQRHSCLILGSDGLWNVVKAQNASDIVNYEEIPHTYDDDPIVFDYDQSNHARVLARSALHRWGNLRADNITVIAVLIDPLESCNQEMVGTLVEHPFLDIESVLTEHPSAMIRILPKQTQIVQTKRVELVYTGACDPMDKSEALSLYGSKSSSINWSYQYRNTASTYHGPGYSSFDTYGDKKKQDWLDLIDNWEKFLSKPIPSTSVPQDDNNVFRLIEKTDVEKSLENCRQQVSDNENENNIDLSTKTLSVTSSVDQQKSCNSRAMLINNRPNVITQHRRERGTNYASAVAAISLKCCGVRQQQRVAEYANLGETPPSTTTSSVSCVLTTPKRRASKNSAHTSTGRVARYRKRRCVVVGKSASVTPTYNLRCGGKRDASTTPQSKSAALNGKVLTQIKRCPYRCSVASTTTRQPSRVVSRRAKSVACVNASTPKSPYALRDRPQSAAAVVVEIVAPPIGGKKRNSTSATGANVVRPAPPTVSTIADDMLSVSFAKRLKIFVDSGLNRFRRE